MSSTAALFLKVERQRKVIEDDLQAVEKFDVAEPARFDLIKKIEGGLANFQSALNTLEESGIRRETDMDKRALCKECVSALLDLKTLFILIIHQILDV
jgi:predicted DNA-binding protein YlxM (UPF0122 family)